jgi:hypothetical protein
MSKKDLIHPKVWVATVDIGLVHQRVTYTFRDIAEGGIINVNSSNYAQKRELFLWRRLSRGYECFSRAKFIPLLGNPLFSILDSLQHIPS